MQQKLIQARAHFTTLVHVQIQPDEEDRIAVLDEPDLGLAKQIVINDSVFFVDAVSKVVQEQSLPIDLENIVLSTKRDVLMVVVQEPIYADKSL